MKKFSAILLAVIMMLSMVAMAANDGSITIYNTSTEKDYEIWKVFDATFSGSNVSYTYTGNVTDAMQNGPFTFTESTTEGIWVVTKDENVTDAAIIEWVTENAETIGTKIDTLDGNGGSVTKSGLAYGYYYITTGSGSVVTIDSAIKDVEVRDKNTTEPGTPDEGELKEVDDKEVAVGDTANFDVEFVAVNYKTTATATTKIEKYTVTDTPTGMTIDTTSVKVYVDSTEITDFTATADSDTGVVTIEIDWVDDDGKHLYSSPVDVKITYSATINDVAAENGAKNNVVVSDGQGTELKKEVELTLVDFKVLKYTMANGVETKLDGAKFKLYDAEDKQIYVTDDDNGVYSVTTEANEVLIEAGEVTIKGLDADVTYYLEEVEAPQGYNKLTEKKAVNLSTTETVTVKVENKTGTELPETGGMGTTLFYVVGSLMMAAAVVVLVAKKKVAAK